MVSHSKPGEDSLAFDINVKAKIKLLIAGFGLLHHSKISNFLISQKYNCYDFIVAVTVGTYGLPVRNSQAFTAFQFFLQHNC